MFEKNSIEKTWRSPIAGFQHNGGGIEHAVSVFGVKPETEPIENNIAIQV